MLLIVRPSEYHEAHGARIAASSEHVDNSDDSFAEFYPNGKEHSGRCLVQCVLQRSMNAEYLVVRT